MKMKNAISQFQNYMIVQRGFSPLTVKAYKSDLEKFEEFLNKRELQSTIENIRTQDVVSYLSYLTYPDDNKKPNQVISRARKLASIRSFFTFLRKSKVIEVSPTTDIDLPKLPQTEPDYLTINEYQKLLAKINEIASPFFKLRDLSIISLFISTGIRVSELVNLRLRDLDLEERTIKVRRKGNKNQTIPLNKDISDLIGKYLKVRPETKSNQLFISKKRNGVKSNTVYCLVSKYLKLSGIQKGKKGPHLLRHTCFTTLLSKNVNPVVIQQLAGHVNFNTTKKYLHLNSTQIREAVTKINLLKGDL
jgi:integrase/recombinase XerD